MKPEPPMSVTDRNAVSAAAVSRLRALAGELSRAGWQARLIDEPGRVPNLLVHNPDPAASALTEHIYCAPRGDGWAFWWSWAEPISADVTETAAIIGRVLRTADPTPAPGSNP
jgi:hypothetical protein